MEFFVFKSYNISMDASQKDTKITLPKGFLLGAAAAAHQVEGNNINSDWWAEEKKGRVPKSGLATDHYHKYEEDFRIAHEIGLNAFRISIEWARIEPVEGRFEASEVENEGVGANSDGNASSLHITFVASRKRWI
jgi:hypothetical protein